ncbi:phosphatase [Streptomyces sp. NTH33]|uniref:PP2C family protein-serine/threonine phosphatase n=1 Tax=Streptomyces sp. NTH33 TaxID=1735453 RepID=UPI000DA9FD9B|nr:PP2C family protein-serine/threonine phosphatase [Streptomyces sp. NTH33]PZH01140.1 phosphatase [Streptomyces sp. NTH33]
MPPHLSADRSPAQPPGRGPLDALISQARRLKGEVDAVRRGAQGDASDPQGRWERALCDLALHQLDELDDHLAQLRDGPPPVTTTPVTAPAAPPGSLLSRVGSAEWNLLTGEAGWSGELFRILGRNPVVPPLTLDELPSVVLEEDRPRLTAMVTDCLVDARPIDGEFRIVRPDGAVRTVHMMGEPVLDADGSTTSMWAVLRDVSELRRSQSAVRETRDSLQHHRHRAQTEHRLAVELQEAVLPPWRGSLRFPHRGRPALDLAAHYLPSSAGTPFGGDWYDALELADGDTLLGVGDLTGHGPGVTSGMAMLLGAVRGMALAGSGPGQLMTWLNQLLDGAAQPALGSAVCCRYRPATRTLTWARAGHPAPLLFRGGTGWVPDAPHGVLLGATPGSCYGQAEETLEVGDLLLLHTDGLVPRRGRRAAAQRLLDLAPRFTAARDVQDCVRTVVEEFGGTEREDGACVLAARVMS